MLMLTVLGYDSTNIKYNWSLERKEVMRPSKLKPSCLPFYVEVTFHARREEQCPEGLRVGFAACSKSHWLWGGEILSNQD